MGQALALGGLGDDQVGLAEQRGRAQGTQSTRPGRATHPCSRALGKLTPTCHSGPPAGAIRDCPRSFPDLSASCAADPHSLAGADHRARHRPLCLCAGAARHARLAVVVLFRGGLHEHDQRRRLSRRRLDGIAADQALWPCAKRDLGHRGLRRVAGALRDHRQFHRAEFCAVARGLCRGRGLCRRRRACGDHRANPTGKRAFPAQPVLCRTGPRYPRFGTDRALRVAGVRPGLVVDRVVGVHCALACHDHAARARAARWQG